MRPPRLAEIGLLIAGTLVGWLACELAVRAFWPQIFERHPRGMYTTDPEVGYVLTPEYQGVLRRSEFTISVKTGRLGLRGGDPRPRRLETFRILILGDSQVWGHGVEDDETVSCRLEELLASRHPELDIQVLNGGVPGYGTADELSFLRSRGGTLDPDLVLLVFLPVNDFDENRVPAGDWADVEDGYLVWKNTPNAALRQPALQRVHRWLKMHSHAARLVSDSLGYATMRGGLLRWAGSLWQTGESFSAQDAERASRLLQDVVETARTLDAEVLFVYSTGQDRVLATSYAPPRSAAVVEQAARSAGVPWIEVTPALRGRPERLELFYPRDGHWTASGHRAVAEILTDKIESAGLVERALESP